MNTSNAIKLYGFKEFVVVLVEEVEFDPTFTDSDNLAAY